MLALFLCFLYLFWLVFCLVVLRSPYSTSNFVNVNNGNFNNNNANNTNGVSPDFSTLRLFVEMVSCLSKSKLLYIFYYWCLD